MKKQRKVQKANKLKVFLLKHKDSITSVNGILGGFAVLAAFALHYFNITGVDKLKVALILIFAACFSLNAWFSGKRIDEKFYNKIMK